MLTELMIEYSCERKGYMWVLKKIDQTNRAVSLGRSTMQPITHSIADGTV